MNRSDQHAEQIFATAIELSDESARRAYLDRACVGDEKLRAEVESLLASHQQAGDFLQTEISDSATALNAPFTENSGTRIGRYKLLEQIGEGGFGIVWMAEQEEPVRRRVALKIIKLGMDTREVVARFEAERQALALMDHPNIARVFDGGTTESGRPYFVMELVRGEPITKYCDEQRLSLDERLELFVHVCQAVQHAHQKGVIHRDLKPSNILVAIHDDKPVPKVIDFGIAKATQQRLTEKTLFTRFNQFVGTPAYMSPEQAGLSSLDIDTRSDIYSLGVLLYELLTGRTPFSKEELFAGGYEEICRIIREKEPPKPSTRLSTMSDNDRRTIATQRKIPPEKLGRLVRGELDWVVMKALEKDRARRYESATALAGDIERFLNHEPVSAAAPSLSYRFGKFARRNRVALVTAGLFAIVLIAGTVISTWQALRARAHEREAKRQFSIATNATEQANSFLAQSRHEEGKAWLERAEIQLKEQSYFWAKLMAARAIGFEGFGRASESAAFQTNFPILLKRGSEEFQLAENLLKREPDTWPVWQSPVHRHHEDGIDAIRFIDGGQRLVSFGRSEADAFRIWDVASGHLVASRKIVGLIAAVSGDGATAVVSRSSSEENSRLGDGARRTAEMPASKLVLVDIVTGAETSLTNAGFLDPALLTMNSTGSRLAGVSQDKLPRVFDRTTRRLIMELKGPSEHQVAGDLVFSERGDLLLGLCLDGQLRAWSAADGKEVFSKVLPTHLGYGGGRKFSLSSDNRQLATVNPEGDGATIWEFPAGTELWKARAATAGWLKFSPGQKYLAVAGRDQIDIWDAASRKLATSLETPGSFVGALAFTPDEGLIAAVLGDTIVIWELPSGKRRTDSPGAGKGYPWANSPWGKMGFWNVGTSSLLSPDGTQIALPVGASAALTDLRTGHVLRTFSCGAWGLSIARFSPDSEMLATGGVIPDGQLLTPSARIWEISTGKLKAELSAVSLGDMAFSPDGQSVATLSAGAVVQLWNVKSGAEIQRFQHPDAPQKSRMDEPESSKQLIWVQGSLAFNPVTPLLAAACETNVVLWDTREGKETGRFEARSPNVQWTPDGQTLICAGQTLQFWDLSARQFRGANVNLGYLIDSFDLSPDATMLAIPEQLRNSPRWRVHLVDVASGSKVGSLMEPGMWNTTPVFTPDGAEIALQCDGGFRMWRLAAEGEKASWIPRMNRIGAKISQWQRFYFQLAYSPDGQMLISADSGRVDFWDSKTGRSLRSFPEIGELITRFALNADGTALAVASGWPFFKADGTVKLFDVKTGELRHRLKSEFAVGDLSFSPDSATLATVNGFGRVQLWEVDSGKEIGSMSWSGWHELNRPCLAYSSDGKLLAISDEQSVRLWSVETRQLVRELSGAAMVRSLKFTPDGRRLASIGFDGLKIWDLARGAQVRAVYPPSTVSWPTVGPSITFSPDGGRVVSVCGDVLSLWDIDTGKELRSLRFESGFLGVAFHPGGKIAATTQMDRHIRTFDVEHLIRAELPLAQHMASFRWEGREFVDIKTATDNLYHSREATLYSWSTNTHLQLLHSGQPTSEIDRDLFWRYLRARNWPSAQLLLKRLVGSGQATAEREGLTAALLRVAEDCLEQGSFDAARHYASQASEVTSNSSAAWEVMARAQLRLGQHEEALGAVRHALVLKPGDVDLLLLEGDVQHARSNYVEALDRFQQALQIAGTRSHSSQAACLLKRAEINWLMSHEKEAARDRCQALDIPARPSDANLHLIDLSPFYNASLTEDLYGVPRIILPLSNRWVSRNSAGWTSTSEESFTCTGKCL